jgi:hypothetical protein
MEALNQTSSSLPLVGKLRACSQRQAVAAASMSVRTVKLWNDVRCKVLHINLFTAVLVTLIIQHGSSSHIEGSGEGASCGEREGKHNGGKKRFVHTEIVIITLRSLILEHDELDLLRRKMITGRKYV